jgi:hypothetical protein
MADGNLKGSGVVSGPWTNFFTINQKRLQACKGLPCTNKQSPFSKN